MSTVSPLVWVITCVVILGLFVFDFFAHVKTPHAPSFTESASWSAVYIGIAIAFGLLMTAVYGGGFGGEYFAGFVTEKSLSVDNLFVFVIIMAKFAVPKENQQKVLLVGIVLALVMRAGFIAVGAAAIAEFSWVFYLFGVFLIYTAVKLVREAVSGDGDDEAGGADVKDNRIVGLVQKVLPTTEEYHGDRLTTRIKGKRFVTPMLIVMISIGLTDILFALDSIPAIFGLTQDPYIVFTANAFALMGLRQLFFLVDGLLARLVYLSWGLSFILGFIGVKLIVEALHENSLPFINGGEHITALPTITTPISLAVILGTLVVTTVASLLKTRGAVPAEDVSELVAAGDVESVGAEHATGEAHDPTPGADAVPGRPER